MLELCNGRTTPLFGISVDHVVQDPDLADYWSVKDSLQTIVISRDFYQKLEVEDIAS